MRRKDLNSEAGKEKGKTAKHNRDKPTMHTCAWRYRLGILPIPKNPSQMTEANPVSEFTVFR